MIVSFSGIDSAGKTTQIELLMQYFEKHNIKAKKVWGKARITPGVILLKQLFRKDKGFDDEQKVEYRKSVFRDPRKEKMVRRYVICDRYVWDTYVEINSDFTGIDIDKSVLWKMVRFVSPKPKISFVFVVPPEVSLDRDYKKNAAGIETIEVKQEKINRYLRCIEANCWTNVMNGMQSIEQLHEQVLEILSLD